LSSKHDYPIFSYNYFSVCNLFFFAGELHTVDGYRNPVHHLGCIQHKVAKNGIFTTSTYQLVTAGFLPSTVHSLKLTWPLKMGLPKRKVIFQPSIFRGYIHNYVKLQGVFSAMLQKGNSEGSQLVWPEKPKTHGPLVSGSRVGFCNHRFKPIP